MNRIYAAKVYRRIKSVQNTYESDFHLVDTLKKFPSVKMAADACEEYSRGSHDTGESLDPLLYFIIVDNDDEPVVFASPKRATFKYTFFGWVTE